MALAVLILVACAYFLFSVRSGGAGVAGDGAADVYRLQLAEVPRLIEKALRGAAAPVLASQARPALAFGGHVMATH